MTGLNTAVHKTMRDLAKHLRKMWPQIVRDLVIFKLYIYFNIQNKRIHMDTDSSHSKHSEVRYPC